MAFKIKNIISGYIMQLLHVIILVSVLVFIMLFSNSKKKEIIAAASISRYVSLEIQYLDNDIDKIKNISVLESKFSSDLASTIIISNENKIEILSSSLDDLFKMGFVKDSLGSKFYHDTLQANLSDYRNSFELTVLAFLTKGNRNVGLVKELGQTINELYDTLLNAPEGIPLATKLEKLSENYYHTLQFNELETLNNFCQTLTGNFLSYADYNPILITESVYKINSFVEELKNIEDKLYNQEYGLVNQLDENYKSLVQISNRYEDFQKKAAIKYMRKWNFIFILLTVLFTIVYLLILFLTGKASVNNYKRIVNYCNNIVKGDFEKRPNVLMSNSDSEYDDVFGKIGLVINHMKLREQFIEKLLNNEFDEDLDLRSKKDNYSKLLNSLKDKMLSAQNEHEQREEDNATRRYINEGLAKFSDIMRINSNNTEMLGDNLIKELVRYLDAIQGGIFLTDQDDNNVLNLISAFAFNRKKYLNKTIVKGEGLIGTCAIEKGTINLTEIPSDYLMIKSGLGDTPPDNILIIPVMNENDLVGVIELASLKKFSEHEIELCEQIANSLASSIIAVRTNHRTAQLLEKSQQQAAEMAEQEEEMRQNMEELKATQEESGRREEQMQGILEAIGNSFYFLEYHINGRIFFVNEKVINFLGQSSEEIIGKKHVDLFSSKSRINTELIDKIVETKEHVAVSEVLSWGRRKLKYSYYLSPVKDRIGEVSKIINLFTVEEEEEKND